MTIANPQKYISIPEFGSLYTKEGIEPSSENALISERAFLSLEKFISEGKKGEENILTMSFHKKYGKIIKAQNYVGVIQTDDGTTIEILPKIHREQDEKNVRSIFLKMLKALKDSPFKNINEAHLRTHKFPILEIFIKSFLDELTLLIKKGIKKNYILIEGNERFLKGRLKVMDNIRRNSLHKERFAVEYDDFTEDIAENRLIKSTLLKLNAISKNNENKKRIKEFLLVFNEISKSGNIEQDIDQSSHISRLHSYYTSTLSWVRIFLREESVVSMAGKSVAFSLLFSMEKIFENYVAKKIKEKRPEWIVKTQDKKYSLIEDHKTKPKFQLKPDIVIENENIVMDTKWKLINENDEVGNYGITQGDMYQLYAYARKYHSERLYLIYPRTDAFLNPSIAPFYYHNGEGENIELIPVSYDLENDECIIF